MRKLSIVLLLFLLSCSGKWYPHAGSYPQTPIVYSSDKTFEQVWDNIIDFFAQKGIPISLIDKSSGLIISTKTKLSWSREDKKTHIIRRKDAFVVVDDFYNPGTRKYDPPSSVTGIWNIRVKKKDAGGVSININLNDLVANVSNTLSSGLSIESPTNLYHPQSTGIFEQLIYDIIK